MLDFCARFAGGMFRGDLRCLAKWLRFDLLKISASLERMNLQRKRAFSWSLER